MKSGVNSITSKLLLGVLSIEKAKTRITINNYLINVSSCDDNDDDSVIVSISIFSYLPLSFTL